MINALHLIWIIPTAASFGFFWAAIFAVGKRSDKDNNDKGVKG